MSHIPAMDTSRGKTATGTFTIDGCEMSLKEETTLLFYFIPIKLNLPAGR